MLNLEFSNLEFDQIPICSYCAQFGSQLAGLALNVKKKMPRGEVIIGITFIIIQMIISIIITVILFKI